MPIQNNSIRSNPCGGIDNTLCSIGFCVMQLFTIDESFCQ